MKIKLLRDGAKVPVRATEGAAGYDLCACIENDIILKPHEIKIIPTGISVMAEKNTAVMIYARSGLSTKYGISLANGVGVVDSDYRGEIKAILINLDSEHEFVIKHGDRIAQIVFTKVPVVTLEEVDELSETERGTGGFGSSGIGA